MALTEAEFDEWIIALRSGDYKKGQGQLYNTVGDTYCCLGVLSHQHKDVGHDDWATCGRAGGVANLPPHFNDDGVLHRVPEIVRENVAEINDFCETFGPVIDYLLAHKDEIVGAA